LEFESEILAITVMPPSDFGVFEKVQAITLQITP